VAPTTLPHCRAIPLAWRTRVKPLLSCVMNGAASVPSRKVTGLEPWALCGSTTDDAPAKWGSASIYFVLQRTGARNR
jgi:hypothetical protein